MTSLVPYLDEDADSSILYFPQSHFLCLNDYVRAVHALPASASANSLAGTHDVWELILKHVASSQLPIVKIINTEYSPIRVRSYFELTNDRPLHQNSTLRKLW